MFGFSYGEMYPADLDIGGTSFKFAICLPNSSPSAEFRTADQQSDCKIAS